MLKTIQYINHSCEVFAGFYESWLFNSDSILNVTCGEPTPPDGYYYDMYDYNGFCYEVGKVATESIFDSIPDSIVKSYKYMGISSPRFYNYSTDKICVDVEVDYDNLKDYCLNEKRDEFEEYLHDNFTSYDGFISFVDNNVKDFESNLDNESEKYDNVMLEFLITKCDWDDDDTYDAVNCELWNRLCLRRESDNKAFDYTVDDKCENVIIGEEINENAD